MSAFRPAAGGGGGGALPGQVESFRRSKLPTGWTTLQGAAYIPSQGVAIEHQYGAFIHGITSVTEGEGAGFWIQSASAIRLFDINSGTSVGEAVALPANARAPFCCATAALGTSLFVHIIETNRLYRFDTESRVFTRLADFPRVITGYTRALVLPDGRIVFTSSAATGLTVSASALPLWVYDPVTGAAPVEIVVSLPVNPLGPNGHPTVSVLPDGRLIAIDARKAAGVLANSCNVAITGNTTTVGEAEPMGIPLGTAQNSTCGLFVSSVGVFTHYGETYLAYSSGHGWATINNPAAYGHPALGNLMAKAPGQGHISAFVASQTLRLHFTGAACLGDPIIQATKN